VLAETLALSMIFIPYWQTDMLEKEHNPQYISTSQSLVKKRKNTPADLTEILFASAIWGIKKSK
jgi:hypothetical protein